MKEQIPEKITFQGLIRSVQPRSNVINRAVSVMSSPVHKTLYVRQIPKDIDYLICGVKALSKTSMIAAKETDAGIAVDGSNSKKIPKDDQISYQDFLDFGGYPVEVWKYNPLSLSDNEYADDLSLILEMTDCKDERIQNCLDEIRNKYGIEVNDISQNKM